MRIERNPYRPGVGLEPPYLAGREKEQNRFLRALRAAPEIPANIRLSGLRGVGKTVLLRRLQDLADREGWATVWLEVQPSQNSDTSLREAFSDSLTQLQNRLSLATRIVSTLSNTMETIRRLPRVSLDGFEWSMAGDLSEVTRDLGEVLLEATNASVNQGKQGLVVLLDEAQILTDDSSAEGSHALSMLVAAFSALQKSGSPACLVLCGLPTLAVNLLRARTYSERMFQGITLQSLPREAATQAFMEPLRKSSIQATDELLNTVLDEVEGYPYFIQLWGAELWETSNNAGVKSITIDVLDAVREAIYDRLDEDFYEPRIQALTPAEQDLILDTAKCSYPPILVNELNGRSNKASGNVNVLLGRIVAANVLYRPRKGQYLYTAPGFREYLLRRSGSY